MKIVFASDSFKGSLSSPETAELLGRAAREVFGKVETESVLCADGGEGTADAVTNALGGERVPVTVRGPLGGKVAAFYGRLPGGRAIVESAAASGLTLVPEEKRDVLRASSFGTGELIAAAISGGAKSLAVGIGGTAMNDGGTGCLRALGARFYDENGAELEGRGEDLEKIRRADFSELEKRMRGVEITVMCDVLNPLCGEKGATRTFARQKGASDEDIERLEKGMENWREALKKSFSKDPNDIPGAGAAGGLGAALSLVLGGKMRSGIDAVLDLVAFDEKLEGADLVVTGEGKLDSQSEMGKAAAGVARRAKDKGVPTVALCGSVSGGGFSFTRLGISSLMTTVNAPMSLDAAMKNARELYYDAAVRMFAFIKLGREMR